MLNSSNIGKSQDFKKPGQINENTKIYVAYFKGLENLNKTEYM